MRGKSGGAQFVDTNVLVYAHDISAGEKHNRAKALVEELWEKGTGCLSVQVLQEFYVTITQKVPKPISREIAAQIIASLAKWRVHAPGAADVLEAIEIQQHHRVSFWDAMIIRSAEALGCEILWSEDFSPGQQYGKVRVLNPFA
ncbi:MAG: PIN domain-containing protein [Thermoanaerobacteraceae bacterium]|nr:PIN domain-containing protein [Thermoanaerobacteraceae bacterium]